MASTIQWRLMFRVANRAAFDMCLARVVPLMGEAPEVREAQPYWKVPELWECAFVAPVASGGAAEQVLSCLRTAQRLASGWHVLGTLSAESADGFSGVFAAGQSGAASKVPGLEWASFDVAAGGPIEPNAAPGPAPTDDSSRAGDLLGAG